MGIRPPFVEQPVQDAFLGRSNISSRPNQERLTARKESQGREGMILGAVGVHDVEAAFSEVMAKTCQSPGGIPSSGPEIKGFNDGQPQGFCLFQQRAAWIPPNHDPVTAFRETGREPKGVVRARVVPPDGGEL
jgi:hypothetical protein